MDGRVVEDVVEVVERPEDGGDDGGVIRIRGGQVVVGGLRLLDWVGSKGRMNGRVRQYWVS